MNRASFLFINMWYDEYTARAEMFCLNFVNLTPGFVKLWSELSEVWFLLEIYPQLPISKAVTVHL